MLKIAAETDAQLPAAPGLKAENVEQANTNRGLRGGMPAAQAATLPSALGGGVQFPGEDGGSSLAELAQSDLDAALQLLAHRAQYITGANGAAIALRRRGKNDMQCRASAGENVPELGALLSTEFGLSGESVRTRRALRCDDAERDPRVNREGCRQLGIASVVVMPVVNDDEVLGVFELFSGKVNAFGERDLSALQRLSEMVETAVRLARAAESLPQQLEVAATAVQPVGSDEADDKILGEEIPSANDASGANAKINEDLIAALEAPRHPKAEALAGPGAGPAEVTGVPVKPLLWSAAMNSVTEAETVAEPDRSHVPPGLRNLRSCETCGFPVSLGRALCVECEEKRWRGQLKRPSAVLGAKVGLVPQTISPPSSDRQSSQQSSQQFKVPQSPALDSLRAGFLTKDARNGAHGIAASSSGPVARLVAAAAQSAAAPAPALAPGPSPAGPEVVAPPSVAALPLDEPGNHPKEVDRCVSALIVDDPTREVVSETGNKMQEVATPDFVLSAGLEPSRSWLVNLYVVGVLLLVAAAVAATILLH
jgi:hypothetical protein